MEAMGNAMLAVQPSRFVRVLVLTPESNRLAPVQRVLHSRFHESRFRIRLRVDGAVFVQFWTQEDASMLEGHAWVSDDLLDHLGARCRARPLGMLIFMKF